MDFDVASAVTGMALTLWGVWVGHWFGERRTKNEAQRALASSAAADVVASLRGLQRLLREHDARRPVAAHDVGRAIQGLGEAEDRHGHRLPDKMSHVRKSVLDAVGTVFGAVAFAHTHHDTDDYPLEPPHHMWATYADEYIDYVATHLNRWGDTANPCGFDTYNSWLLNTGRRNPPGTNHPARALTR